MLAGADLDLHRQFGLVPHRRPRRGAPTFDVGSATDRYPIAAAASAAVEARRLTSASSSYTTRM